MIRRLQRADINRVADIWLDTNLKAHDFIPTQYWRSNFELVKEMSLLNFVKAKKTKLCLNVYQKNVRAIHFYQKEGFEIQSEGLDEATGEKDYAMRWESRILLRTIHKKKKT